MAWHLSPSSLAASLTVLALASATAAAGLVLCRFIADIDAVADSYRHLDPAQRRTWVADPAAVREIDRRLDSWKATSGVGPIALAVIDENPAPTLSPQQRIIAAAAAAASRPMNARAWLHYALACAAAGYGPEPIGKAFDFSRIIARREPRLIYARAAAAVSLWTSLEESQRRGALQQLTEIRLTQARKRELAARIEAAAPDVRRNVREHLPAALTKDPALRAALGD